VPRARSDNRRITDSLIRNHPQVNWPGLPGPGLLFRLAGATVIEAGGGDVPMAEPFLDFSDIDFVGEGVLGGGCTHGIYA